MKLTTITEFSFDEAGKLQAKMVDAQSSVKQKPGIRGKMQESAAEDKMDYVGKALELSLAYTYMTKGELIDFFGKATVTEANGIITAIGDNGLAKVEDTQIMVDEWWSDLTPQEQENPANVAKHETAERVLQTTGNLLNGMDAALNDDQYASVQYSLTKTPKDMWNFVVGSQFQINKHLMIRAEYGFLGSRQQLITGLQYRFGL